MKTPAFLPLILSFLVILVFFTGCETTSSKTEAPPAEAFIVKRGDSVMSLIEQMGEPDQKSTIEKSGSSGSIWTYRHLMHSGTRLVTKGFQEIPVRDPQTNGIMMIPERILESETDSVTQVTEFLIMDGKVISWKQRIDEQSTRVR
ncbi:MAG: hypothetical protein HN457_03850 [Opitutales bacterium]|jgi:hypothetical protein|nr:hypothetical protein [Opitutales bacterium]MBT5168497.1 hypothetical protein [Opitutales bacterium]MBT5815527.1 hypothetical protein [Opitutales bacterium]MBT6379615.1 hypothetical protein [Opitutales bacterium]MBT6767759.1 hypothetical protein [Opitutales bacterium]